MYEEKLEKINATQRRKEISHPDRKECGLKPGGTTEAAILKWSVTFWALTLTGVIIILMLWIFIVNAQFQKFSRSVREQSRSFKLSIHMTWKRTKVRGMARRQR